MTSNGYRISLGDGENVLKLAVMVVQFYKYTKDYCALKMSEFYVIGIIFQ